MKKVCLLLIFCLCITTVTMAADYSGRSIVISKVDGSDVKMTKGTKQAFNAKEGYKLGEGYTVSTGNDSYCYLKLDNDTVVKTDQQSKVAVGKASKNKLSLSVQSGSILVDAGIQEEGQVIETRIGNTGLTIRGTIYTIGYDADGMVAITMLSGSGVADGHILPAGTTMFVYDDKDISKKTYEIIAIDIEKLDLFTLLAIWEYQDLLLDSGLITSETLEKLYEMIEDLLPLEVAAVSNPRMYNASNNVMLTWDAFDAVSKQDIQHLTICAQKKGDRLYTIADHIPVTTTKVNLFELFSTYHNGPLGSSVPLTEGIYNIIIISEPNGNKRSNAVFLQDTVEVFN